MSDTENQPVRAKVLRDFGDAGTERRFTKDKVVELTPGEFENFRVAGLVEAAADETPAPVDDTPKPSRTR